MKKEYLLMILLLILVTLSAAAEMPEGNHVYRGIYFGMSVKEFHENLRSDEKMELSIGIPEIEIAGTVYNIFALYDDDRLYEIYFESPNYIANYYIRKRIDELNELIEADYGEADIINEFEIAEVKDEILWRKKWETEEKNIEIGVGKLDTENYVSLHMIYMPIYEEILNK
jgi:hypothetical protein